MKDETIKNLIRGWQSVHDTMSPSQKLSQGSEIDRTMAELSVLSGRREHWELFVCLMGFADKINEDHNKVLSMLVGDVHGGERTQVLAEFEDYWNDFATLPTDVIGAAADTMSLVLGHEGILIESASTSIFELCMSLHNGDPEKVLKCMQEKRNG
jgi:hypothetical protein